MPFYESTRKLMECDGYLPGQCPCTQDNQVLDDTAILPEEEMEEADQAHCDARTQKKADEPGKPKFKFSGGTCEVGGCASGYMPNKEKTGCIQMPKK